MGSSVRTTSAACRPAAPDAVATDRSGPATAGFGRCQGIGTRWPTFHRESGDGQGRSRRQPLRRCGLRRTRGTGVARRISTMPLANVPDNLEIATALYDAYLELGTQEAAAGRLKSARSAFAGALAVDSSRPDATMALARLAPYSRPSSSTASEVPSDSWPRVRAIRPAPTARVSSLCIFQNQGSSPASLSESDNPLNGQDFAALLRIDETSGDGMVTIETGTDPNGGGFAVDPTRRTWRCSNLIRKTRGSSLGPGPMPTERKGVRRSRPSSCA